MLDQSVGVIGVGRLGSDVAFALAERDLCDIVLYDQEVERAEYLAADLSDTSFGHIYNRRIRWVSRMADLAECSVILLAAGKRLSQGSDLSDVFSKNAELAKEMAAAFVGSSSIFVVASEPVDLMTLELTRRLQLPPSRVLGIGGIVDAFIARNALGEALDVSPDYIRTHVVGPHGSSAQLAWSFTSINGVPVDQIADAKQREAIETHTRTNLENRLQNIDASRVRYAPAMASVELIRSIVKDDRRILSVTIVSEGTFGIDGIALSLPCVIGRFGADRVIAPEVSDPARKNIQSAANTMKKLLAGGAA